jgi:hypothetical protein
MNTLISGFGFRVSGFRFWVSGVSESKVKEKNGYAPK